MRLPSMERTLTRIWSPSRSSSLTSFDAVLGDLGDVEETVGAGEDLDEGAELGEADDLAEVGLADLRDGGDVGDHLDGAGEAVGVGGGDVDAAGVVDIDLDAGGVDDAADDLAAGSDEVADLVGGDLDGVDAGRELRLLFARREPMVASMMSSRWRRPWRACSRASRMIWGVMPMILMSICRAVMPLRVPATLKSMSP